VSDKARLPEAPADSSIMLMHSKAKAHNKQQRMCYANPTEALGKV
jgi:hypothetical protein